MAEKKEKKKESLVDVINEIVNDPELDEFVKKQEEMNRGAVLKVLIPSLSMEVREFAQCVVNICGPNTLAKAIEAVSVLIRQGIDMERPDVKQIRLFVVDGSVTFDGFELIKPGTLALEVARYTNLWCGPSAEECAVPSMFASQIALWICHAAGEQPYLLRHFRSRRLNPHVLELLTVKPEEETVDAPTRWMRGVEEKNREKEKVR